MKKITEVTGKSEDQKMETIIKSIKLSKSILMTIGAQKEVKIKRWRKLVVEFWLMVKNYAYVVNTVVSKCDNIHPFSVTKI